MTYAAVYITSGSVRNVTFEAQSEQEAQTLAEKWGMGVTGPARVGPPVAPFLPAAYDISKAGVMLSGNINKPLSRSSIRRLLDAGKLSRLPGTARLLITRESIEAFCSHQLASAS